MKKLITFAKSGIWVTGFCVLLSFTTNAQQRQERNRSYSNHDRHFDQSPARNNTRGPERHPPVRFNNSHSSVHTPATPPVRHYGNVNRDYRYNGGRNGHYNGNWNHYNNRPPRYNAYNPSWRYHFLPRRNTVINVFPFSYQTINFGGCGYRYYNGTYYRPYNNAYIVVAPPLGLYIHVLPVGYRRIYVNNYPYYYYNGTYYDEYQDNYRVVAPPVGATVESLPEGYETVTIDGETYYKVDGVQYKPVVEENGEIWYEVIKVD